MSQQTPHTERLTLVLLADEHLECAVARREPVRMSAVDAGARRVPDGDIVGIYNQRDSCLAGAVVTTAVRPGVIQLSTGAWFDPADAYADRPFCAHGNPNVLSTDVGTSELAQGCTGQLAPVEFERFEGEPPPIRAFDRLPFAEQAAGP